MSFQDMSVLFTLKKGNSMQSTTQKQQSEEFRRLIEEERHTLMKRLLRTLTRYVFLFLAIVAPVLAVAFGWLKG